jgi:hypothetical protein
MERERKGPARSVLALAAGALMGLGLPGCQSTPAPEQMSRTTSATAPADLQLMCADAVAKANGVDSSKVLPVASGSMDSQTWRVDLNVAGRSSTCTVDNAGKVLTIDGVAVAAG